MTWVSLQKASEFIERHRVYNAERGRWEIDGNLLWLEPGLLEEMENRGWRRDPISFLMYYDRGF